MTSVRSVFYMPVFLVLNLRNSIYKLSCICDIVRVKEIIWVTPYILKIDLRKLI